MKAPFEERLLYLLKHTDHYNFDTIADIGPGRSPVSTNWLLKQGKKVFSYDLEDYNKIKHPNHKFIKGDFTQWSPEYYGDNSKYDAVLASHVLEHQQNTGLFLHFLHSILKDNGTLFIAVPPHKERIVGGHVTIGWSIGILMYNLILSGFDVRNGRFKKEGYNIIGFVGKEKRPLPKLTYDSGDIDRLKDFFPNDKYFKERFKGDIDSWNWFS